MGRRLARMYQFWLLERKLRRYSLLSSKPRPRPRPRPKLLMTALLMSYYDCIFLLLTIVSFPTLKIPKIFERVFRGTRFRVSLILINSLVQLSPKNFNAIKSNFVFITNYNKIFQSRTNDFFIIVPFQGNILEMPLHRINQQTAVVGLFGSSRYILFMIDKINLIDNVFSQYLVFHLSLCDGTVA